MNKEQKQIIEGFLQCGDVESALKWAACISVNEKYELSRSLLKELKKFYWSDAYDTFKNVAKIDRIISFEILKVCFYATANLSLIKKSSWYCLPNTNNLIQFFKLTTPEWVDDWVNWILELSPRNYRTVTVLVENSLCSQPIHDHHTLGMIECLQDMHGRDSSLYEALINSPAILKSDLWKIFEVEGGGEFSLAAKDKYSHEANTWAFSLKRLANEHKVSRERLLDESLVALEKDFAQFRAGWFSRFFISLQPTLIEIETRQDKFLFLLGSHIKPTVSFAIKHLLQLEKKSLLNTTSFLASAKPIFASQTKSTVIDAFKILESICKRYPAAISATPDLILQAFYSENADVQSKAFDYIDKYKLSEKSEFNDALLEFQEFILPSLKSRLPENVLSPSDTIWKAEENTDEFYEAHSSIQNVVAVIDVNELLDLIASVIETPDKPIDIERMLDGLYRFNFVKCDELVERLTPILKRIKQIVARGVNNWMQFHLALTVLSVLENQNHLEPIYVNSFSNEVSEFIGAFLSRLFHLVEALLDDKTPDLLSVSLPNDSMGFIYPDKLKERIKQTCDNDKYIPIIEKTLAILRIKKSAISEAELAEVVSELLDVKSEFSNACAYALGADVEIGNIAALWISASRIRYPYAEDKIIAKVFGELGPDSSIPAHYKTWVYGKKTENYTFSNLIIDVTPVAPMRVPYEHWSVLFHKVRGDNFYGNMYFGQDTALVKWGSTIVPSNLESYFACGARELDITWAEAQWHVQSFFEPLLEPSVPLGEMARLLLIAGLSSKEQGQRGTAIDILIGAIQDGRFKYEEFGRQMSLIITTPLIVVSRWTKALKEISEVSPKHAKSVHLLIQSALTFEPEDSPRELGGLLELLYELSVILDKPANLPEANKFLINNNKGGKQKKYCAALLKMK